MRRTLRVNPLLTIEVEAAQASTARLFDIRYSEWSGDAVRTSSTGTVVQLREVSRLSLREACQLGGRGVPEVGVFDARRFVVVRQGRGIEIPYAEIGHAQRLVVSFEEGFPLDWLRRYLDDLVGLHLLGHGAALYHAACLCTSRLEVVIPAWRATGKTTLGLQLALERGYAYKGEDNVVLGAAGESYPYTDACHVSLRHVLRFAALRRTRGVRLLRLRSSVGRLGVSLVPGRGKTSTLIRRGLDKTLGAKALVKLGQDIPGFRMATDQPPTRVVLQLVTQEGIDGPIFIPIDLDKMVQRTVAGLQYEREDLFEGYRAFVYATGRLNHLIENAVELERRILRRALAGALCYEVRVPVDGWSAVFDSVDRFLGKIGEGVPADLPGVSVGHAARRHDRGQ